MRSLDGLGAADVEVRVIELEGSVKILSTSGGRVDELLVGVALGEADHASVISGDEYRASIPLDMLRSGGIVTIEDGGLRLRVEEGSTLCWNVKDVVMIELTVGRAEDDVPEKPKH